MDNQYTGLNPDTRTAEEKAQDFQQSEMYGAFPLKWEEKTSYKTFTLRDQAQSSSCVGHGTAKTLETTTGIVESAHPIYSRRPKTPEKGMWLQQAGSILYHIGTAREALDASQGLIEDDMNKLVTVETPLKIEAYGFCPINIDSIAQMIEQHGGVALTFMSNYAEWIDVPVMNGVTVWGHCVSAVDYTLYKGEKALVIEDSWGHATSIGNGGQRIITETFLKARCTGAMFFVNPQEMFLLKPKYIFNKNLSFGMKNDEIKILQDCLKYEGLFAKSVESTGYFGSMTKKAVIDFQEKYKDFVLVPAGISHGTGYVASYTRKQLNALYGK